MMYTGRKLLLLTGHEGLSFLDVLPESVCLCISLRLCRLRSVLELGVRVHTKANHCQGHTSCHLEGESLFLTCAGTMARVQASDKIVKQEGDSKHNLAGLFNVSNIVHVFTCSLFMLWCMDLRARAYRAKVLTGSTDLQS